MSRLCGRLKIIAARTVILQWEVGAVFLADGTADWLEASLKRTDTLNFLLGRGGVGVGAAR